MDSGRRAALVRLLAESTDPQALREALALARAYLRDHPDDEGFRLWLEQFLVFLSQFDPPPGPEGD